MDAPISPANGDFITRAFWNAQVTDRFADVLGSWSSYTPVWTATSGVTSPGVGGVLTGAYKQIGRVVCMRLRLALGTSPSLGTGAWSFTTPPDLPPATNQTITGWAGTANASARHPISAFLTNSAGVVRMGISNNILGPGTPFAWATGDQLVLGGEYECA